MFDMPVFSGKVDEVQKLSNGTVKKNRDDSLKTEKVIYESGIVNPNFIEKHKLSRESHSAEFLQVFLPLEMNPYSKSNVERPSFQLLAK